MKLLEKTMENLPADAIREIEDYAEFIASKYRCRTSARSVLAFAGVWRDIPENEFSDLNEELKLRRAGAFKGRRPA